MSSFPKDWCPTWQTWVSQHPSATGSWTSCWVTPRGLELATPPQLSASAMASCRVVRSPPTLHSLHFQLQPHISQLHHYKVCRQYHSSCTHLLGGISWLTGMRWSSYWGGARTITWSKTIIANNWLLISEMCVRSGVATLREFSSWQHPALSDNWQWVQPECGTVPDLWSWETSEVPWKL